MNVGEKVVAYGRMANVAEGTFALPFAYSAVAIAGLDNEVTLAQVLWILVAMLSAWSAATGFNRLVDREIDARNPRTAGREIPRGAITVRAAFLFVLGSSALFLLTAYLLNELAFKLSPFALGFILFYSYTKRFIWVCNILLGVAVGMAAMGGWIGITGRWSPVALTLWAAVAMWVSGFDIIYASQDYDYDRRCGIYSIPARLGLPGAFRLARWLHVGTFFLLASVFLIVPLHYVYLLGLMAISVVFVYQHFLIKPHDLSRVNRASIELNGVVSFSYFGVTLLSVLLV